MERLSQRTLHSILEFVRDHEPALWGEKRPRGFVESCALVALYKDVCGKSFNRLQTNIQKWWPHQRKTLRHNQSILRRLFGQWGEREVQLGCVGDWDMAVRNWRLPKSLAGANLWIDSVDLPLIGKSTIRRKHRKWSWKLNGPGRRYLIIFDGQGRVRKWWGGYSPKIYDGHMLEVKRRWIQSHLQHAVLVGDTHFAWGRKHLGQQVKLHTRLKQPRTGKKGKRKRELSAKEKKYNEDVERARARVERWFAAIKSNVRALHKAWYEEEEELDSMVSFAVGVHNHNKP